MATVQPLVAERDVDIVTSGRFGEDLVELRPTNKDACAIAL